MFKKFLAIILVLSISTLCTSVFCFANCDVDKLEVNTFGINECSDTYDVSLYLSRDSIKELCPESALKKRWIVKNFYNTVLNSCIKKFNPQKNIGCKILSGIATGAAGVGAVGGTATVASGLIGLIGISIQNKYDSKGPDPAGRRSVSSDEDFCNSLWNVFKENENCGVIINFQKNFLDDDRALLSDMNITSQK